MGKGSHWFDSLTQEVDIGKNRIQTQAFLISLHADSRVSRVNRHPHWFPTERVTLGWWWWLSCQIMSDSCDPMDYSPLGSSVHGILQARILEWVAISFSRGSS